MVNPNWMNKRPLGYPLTWIYMGVGPVTLVLAVLVPPLLHDKSPGALASLALLILPARAPMALASAALGSPLSWGSLSLDISSWMYSRSSSYFCLLNMGLSAVSSPSGELFPAEPLVAYLRPIIYSSYSLGVLAIKRRPLYSGQYSPSVSQSMQCCQSFKSSLDRSFG